MCKKITVSVNSKAKATIADKKLAQVAEEIAKNVKIVNILGEPYTVEVTDAKGCPALNNLNGYCDDTTHEIKVANIVQEGKNTPNAKGDLSVQQKRVMRHEIIHAFFFESGLAENAEWEGAYNEELVDWIALQLPKIFKACQEVDAL